MEVIWGITTLLKANVTYNFDATLPNEQDSPPQALGNGKRSSS